MLGATAYGAYKLGKLSNKFSSYRGGGSWNDYNSWRAKDGFLCRNSNDCNWVDPQFQCQDYELDFQPSALWFGGDVARIVGSCECEDGWSFDDDELECRKNIPFPIGAIVGIVFAVILAFLCACGCYAAKKFL